MLTFQLDAKVGTGHFYLKLQNNNFLEHVIDLSNLLPEGAPALIRALLIHRVSQLLSQIKNDAFLNAWQVEDIRSFLTTVPTQIMIFEDDGKDW